jgi:hypothetical protein
MRGHHDADQVGALGLELRQKLDARYAAETDVDDRDRRIVALERDHRRLAAVGDDRFIAGGNQDVGDRFGEFLIVVDDQELPRRCWRSLLGHGS